MLSGLPEQQCAGLCGIMMSPVGFINPVPDIPTDVKPVIMPDPQIALSDLCSIRETNRKVACGHPVLLRLRLTGSVEAKINLIGFQIIHGKEFHCVLHDVCFLQLKLHKVTAFYLIRQLALKPTLVISPQTEKLLVIARSEGVRSGYLIYLVALVALELRI